MVQGAQCPLGWRGPELVLYVVLWNELLWMVALSDSTITIGCTVTNWGTQKQYNNWWHYWGAILLMRALWGTIVTIGGIITNWSTLGKHYYHNYSGGTLWEHYLGHYGGHCYYRVTIMNGDTPGKIIITGGIVEKHYYCKGTVTNYGTLGEYYYYGAICLLLGLQYRGALLLNGLCRRNNNTGSNMVGNVVQLRLGAPLLWGALAQLLLRVLLLWLAPWHSFFWGSLCRSTITVECFLVGTIIFGHCCCAQLFLTTLCVALIIVRGTLYLYQI